MDRNSLRVLRLAMPDGPDLDAPLRQLFAFHAELDEAPEQATQPQLKSREQ